MRNMKVGRPLGRRAYREQIYRVIQDQEAEQGKLSIERSCELAQFPVTNFQ